MTQFVKHSRSMTIEQANAISKKTGGLFVFNYIQWHTAPKAHVCFLDEELEAELLESAQLSKTQLTSILRYFRGKNIIKAVRNVDGIIGYGINPELTGEDNLQELYDSWVDGCWKCNNKVTQEFKGKRSNKGENKGKDKNNKGDKEVKDLRGEPKEIVIHPEEEVIAEVKNYNPVVTDMSPLELLHSMDDEKPFINQKVPELDATMKGNKKSKRMCLGGTMTVEEMNKFWDE